MGESYTYVTVVRLRPLLSFSFPSRLTRAYNQNEKLEKGYSKGQNSNWTLEKKHILNWRTTLWQASREIAEKQRKAREEAENKRIEQIMTKVSILLWVRISTEFLAVQEYKDVDYFPILVNELELANKQC